MSKGGSGQAEAAIGTPAAPPAVTGSLYVHIPFCAARCDYCDFLSSVYDRELAGDYLDALSAELQARCAGMTFATVYIGGGTPTALDHDQFERLIALLRPHVGSECEYTVEANPGTIDDARALILKARGVDRVSLGVQSFSDEKLRMLGRSHTSAEAREAYALLRQREIGNISIDIMIGLPRPAGDVPAAAGPAARDDIEAAVELRPEHLSLYLLSVEPGTRLHGRVAAGELAPAGEGEAAADYELARELLEGAGYQHYEISNYSLPGRWSRHNTAYWTGGAYVGVGASAASFTGLRGGAPGLRSTNVRGVREYVERVRAEGVATASVERLSPERAAREALVLGLRLLAGVDAQEFRARTGRTLRDLCGEAIDSALDRGLLEDDDGILRLSARGVLVSDTLMAELV